MRVIIIKQASDLQALGKRLIGGRAGGSATLERVKALNPHVDFTKIEAGTVLLLPEAPDLKADDKDTRAIGGDAFEEFAKQTVDAFGAAAKRVRDAAESAGADRAAVAAVLKTALVKRQIESDPLLRKQLDEVAAESAAEQKGFQEAAKHVETMHKAVAEELAAMGELLR